MPIAMSGSGNPWKVSARSSKFVVPAVSAAVAGARKAYDSGDHKTAFATVAGLIEKAALGRRAKPPRPQPPAAQKVFLYRDVYGIPHIFADSEESAAYAIAQAQCKDMGMQVFDNLRCGVGRKAEVLGEAQLTSDRAMHLWRVPETAERAWRESPPRTRRGDSFSAAARSSPPSWS